MIILFGLIIILSVLLFFVMGNYMSKERLRIEREVEEEIKDSRRRE